MEATPRGNNWIREIAVVNQLICGLFLNGSCPLASAQVNPKLWGKNLYCYKFEPLLIKYLMMKNVHLFFTFGSTKVNRLLNVVSLPGVIQVGDQVPTFLFRVRTCEELSHSRGLVLCLDDVELMTHNAFSAYTETANSYESRIAAMLGEHGLDLAALDMQSCVVFLNALLVWGRCHPDTFPRILSSRKRAWIAQ
jgi:hypothetical protein